MLLKDILLNCSEAEAFELIIEEDREEEIDLNDLADEILERLANSSCMKCEMVDILEELLEEQI